MRSTWLAILVGPAMLAGFGQRVSAAPEPSLLPESWELDLAFHDPQRITVKLPGEDEPTTYWYVLYTVTNRTGQDVKFYPSFDLVTDTLQVVEGGEDISPMVYQAIRARHLKRYPFFVDPMKVSGTLRQGVDNALTSAVVFRDFDPEASGFTIYFAGLSGEVERMANPAFDPEKPISDENQPFFVLRKTLAIEYDLPGDPVSRDVATPVRRERKWVMR